MGVSISRGAGSSPRSEANSIGYASTTNTSSPITALSVTGSGKIKFLTVTNEAIVTLIIDGNTMINAFAAGTSGYGFLCPIGPTSGNPTSHGGVPSALGTACALDLSFAQSLVIQLQSGGSTVDVAWQYEH